MIAAGQESDDDVDLRPQQVSLFGNKQFGGMPSLKSFSKSWSTKHASTTQHSIETQSIPKTLFIMSSETLHLAWALRKVVTWGYSI